MVTEEGSSSPHTKGPASQRDPGAPAHEEPEGSFGYDYEQAGFADFSHDIGLFTQLGIDPQDLPLWEPIGFCGELASEYDTGAESGQEDVQ